MAARSPEEAHRLWAETFNAGDLKSLSSLYEAEARLVPQPGQPTAVGIQAIRDVLQSFLVRKGKIEIETQSVIQAGDIALLRSHWRLTGSGLEGKRIQVAHSGTEVVRRQPDGSWRYIIDNPFGAD